MTRVKVCGLTRAADVAAAVEAGTDAVGFVVDVPVETPREIPPARAAELAAGVPPFVTTVLVTMPARPEDAVALAGRIDADVVQVHGDLPAGDVAYLSAKVDGHVVAAVDAEDSEMAREYDAIADALLVDTPGESGGGGTGRTHDWEATAALARDLDSPVVLAGGLDPGNVAGAVRTVEPYGVDVASGVEASGGLKDHDAVAAFVERAKAARRRVEP